jgi:hypothetical protein
VIVASVIYALVDPREARRVRYVGCTRSLPRRMSEHRRRRGVCGANAWIETMARDGVEPQPLILAHVTERRSERRWIIRFRERGMADLNRHTGQWSNRQRFVQLSVPLPLHLHDGLRALAAEERRSMNDQLIVIMEAALASRSQAA